MRVRSAWRWWLGVAICVVGCRAVLGIDDSEVVSDHADASLDAAVDVEPDVSLDAAERDVPVLPDAPDALPPDGAADATCDADVISDSKNCGACGHDCRGGDCLAGVCQPVRIHATGAGYMLPAGSSHYVFVSSDPGPDVFRVDRASEQVITTELAGAGTEGLRVTTDFVYFADRAGSRVLRAPASGAFQLTELVKLSAFTGTSVVDVFADENALFIPESCVGSYAERLWRTNLDGSNPTLAAVELPCVSEIEVDGTDIWVGSRDDATAYRIPKSATTVDAGYAYTELLSQDSTVVGSGLELDPDHVWVSLAPRESDDTSPALGIHRFRKDGIGTPQHFVQAAFVTHMQWFDGALYWVDQGDTDQATGVIGRIDPTQPGAQPETLYEGLPAPIGLVVYDDVIYFTALGSGGQGPGIYRVVR